VIKADQYVERRRGVIKADQYVERFRGSVVGNQSSDGCFFVELFCD
jgi:hypothetical protein